MSLTLVGLLYLVSACCFIFGLKQLSSPKSAPRGNLTGAIGMTIAVVVTLLVWDTPGGGRENVAGILIAIVLGAAAGAVLAKKIQMTDMPQLVAIFNGLGGLASAIVALGEVMHATPGTETLGVVTAFGIGIGGLTFTGSVIAFGKLQGIVNSAPMTFPFQKTVNALITLAAALFLLLYASDLSAIGWLFAILVFALALGVLAVIPIGGADMPVVVALLNSYSGIAASAAGYAIGNEVLIIAGALVGASGIILTVIMCKAMNRSLRNVLFGAFGVADAPAGAPAARGGEQRSVPNYTAEDGAIVLTSGQSVIVIPGYGMAVAQAQHSVRELADLLQARGVDVQYAVHPVAGRMPGHMNVLLAEANVPYEQLKEMDEINPLFENTDAVLVIGANDVVNPGARTDKDSPIYGMPILNADKARKVIILKRSLGVGFAGIQNELFFAPNTMMLFGDAKKTILELIAEVKAL